MFASIEDVKSKGEFFKMGSIVPRRILAFSEQKYQRVLCFGADCWAIPTRRGYLVASDSQCAEKTSALHVKNVKGVFKKKKNWDIAGSVYTPGGGTQIQGNFQLTEEEWLAVLNRVYQEMNREA